MNDFKKHELTVFPYTGQIMNKVFWYLNFYFESFFFFTFDNSGIQTEIEGKTSTIRGITKKQQEY